ncbi:hypothetical protein B0A55_06725 [Friedmanniomyces simplex]|uniref:Aminoglycoside phosphotransferase domain-containing protein n=1 Tax=Friedmanniomyces simplex TaxID=329884 RepID=A0A4U0X4A7_9PEZI|nr:hypothetical protein B0A55_06725 [Friedmanniomyces simplex]
MPTTEEWQTPHRAYALDQHTFMKWELKPTELETKIYGKQIQLPQDSKARIHNEFLVLTYLEYAEEDREHVIQQVGTQLRTHILPTFYQHTRHRIGGLNHDERLLLPPRVTDDWARAWSRSAAPAAAAAAATWKELASQRAAFVLCHNDLGQSNIFIDRVTHEIRAIVDSGSMLASTLTSSRPICGNTTHMSRTGMHTSLNRSGASWKTKTK